MAPQLEQAIGTEDIYFAKKLANNEKKVRDKALKKLKLWLSSKSSSENGLTEDELLKIWKGLFYCMWFSDKPLIQEELANNLAASIQLFKPTSTGILFAKVFFVTIGREWLGIDRLRIDKFYMLVRKFIKELLQYLCNVSWDESFVAQTSDFLQEILVNEKYPDGMKMFVTENILQILVDVCSAEESLPSEDTFVSLMMMPFLHAIAVPQVETVYKSIVERILNAALGIKVENKESECLKIPYEKIGDQLSQLATRKDIRTKVRKLFFKYTDKYRQKATESINRKKKASKRKKQKNQRPKDLGNEDNFEETNGIDQHEQKEEPVKKRKKQNAKQKDTLVNGHCQEKEKKRDEESCSGINGGVQVNGHVEETDKTLLELVVEDKGARKKKKKQKPDVIIKTMEGEELENNSIDLNDAKLDTQGEDSVKKIPTPSSNASELNEESKKQQKQIHKNRRRTVPTRPPLVDRVEPMEESVNVKRKKISRKSLPASVSLKGNIQSEDLEEGDTAMGKKNQILSTDEKNQPKPPVVNINSEHVDTKAKEKKRKKKRSTISNVDQPTPLVEFLKTPPPKAFVRKKLAKTEPRPSKQKSEDTEDKVKCDNAVAKEKGQVSRRKSVVIDISKNRTISKRELKLSPMPPYNPDRKPIKGVLKTPMSVPVKKTKRSRATDFF